MNTITIDGAEIRLQPESDFISLTDMARAKSEPGQRANDRIGNWMKAIDTIEFIWAWEEIHNPSFIKGVQMHTIFPDIGRNRFLLTPSKWTEATNAIGITTRAGRTGGTYAHKDIAYHFAMWLEPKFALYVIKEFDRLKSDEARRLGYQWDAGRLLSKVNYTLHTEAIRAFLLPRLD